METYNDNYVYNQRILKLRKSLKIAILINIIFIVTMGIFLFSKNDNVLSIFTVAEFNKIPVVGSMLLFLFNTSQHINLEVFNNSFFKPMFIIEIIYYLAPLIIIQLILWKLTRNIFNGFKMYTSFTIITIIVVAFILINKMNLLIINNAFRHTLWTLSSFTKAMYAVQLILLIAICSTLSKMQKFDWKAFYTHEYANKLYKGMSILCLSCILILGVVFLIGDAQVTRLKKIVSIEYVIDVQSNVEGQVNLVIPDKLIDQVSLIGISIPKTVDVADIFASYIPKEVNLGNMVNGVVASYIDGFSYKIIKRPLLNLKILFSLIFIGFILPQINRLFRFDDIFIYGLQFGLVSGAVLSYGISFGLILGFSIIGVWLAALLHVIVLLDDRYGIAGYFKKLRHRLNEKY